MSDKAAHHALACDKDGHPSLHCRIRKDNGSNTISCVVSLSVPLDNSMDHEIPLRNRGG